MIGDGRFQYLVCATCMLGNMADAVELLCLSFVLTELEQFGGGESGVLSAAIFVGMLFGGWVGGLLADRIGRRPTLQAAVLLNAVFGAATAAVPDSLPWFVCCRVLSGIGVGCSVPVVFGYCSEFVGSKNRGRYINMIAAGWMLGSIIAAAAAWAVIPTLGWRIYVVMCSLPAVTCLILTLSVPESPRWVLLRGDVARATAILSRMARANGRPCRLDDPTKFVLKPLANSAPEDDDFSPVVSPVPGSDEDEDGGETTVYGAAASPRAKAAFPGEPLATRTLSYRLKRLISPFLALFSPSVRRSTLSLALVWFMLSFGWYGLVLWVPKIIDSLDMGLNMYTATLIMQAANLPGNVASFFLSERVSRKRLMSISLACACLSSVGFAFANTPFTVILSASLFNSFSTASWNTLDCLSTESFGTAQRGTAMGTLSALGRIGSTIAQFSNAFLLETSVFFLLIVTSSAMAVAAFGALLTPSDRTGKKLIG